MRTRGSAPARGATSSTGAKHKRVGGQVRDVHNLYLETLAEQGPIGLALLVAMLGIPLVGAWRARRIPIVPAAFGAYVAYLAHASIDWDWELTAVTIAALACGIACLKSDTAPGKTHLDRPWRQVRRPRADRRTGRLLVRRSRRQSGSRERERGQPPCATGDARR